MRPIPAFVLASACLLASSCSKTEGTPQAAGTASAAERQQIEIVADDKGFSPSQVTFQIGTPASLVFVRKSDDTCATQVVFPELKIKKDLPLNQPVTIAIPTRDAGRYTFQCGMGMYKSTVLVRQ